MHHHAGQGWDFIKNVKDTQGNNKSILGNMGVDLSKQIWSLSGNILGMFLSMGLRARELEGKKLRHIVNHGCGLIKGTSQLNVLATYTILMSLPFSPFFYS